MTKKLSARHERFAREYVATFNARAAAQAAGFSENYAVKKSYALLRDPGIAARIEELQSKKFAELDVSAGEVVAMLMRAYNDALEAKQLGPAVRASELLGKRHAMFTDNLQVEDGDAGFRAMIEKLARVNPELAEAMRRAMPSASDFADPKANGDAGPL